MEKASRFSMSFVGKTVKSGQKVNSTVPQLTVLSTKDKFNLNDKARAMLSVTEGSYVVLIDNNAGGETSPEFTTDMNSRYFITTGWDKGNGVYEGAKVGKLGEFSYTGIYAAMLMGDPTVTAATKEDLIKAGKGILNDKGSFISNKKVLFDIVPFAAEVEGEDGTTERIEEFEVAPGRVQRVYALTNVSYVDHEYVAPTEAVKAGNGAATEESEA